jgi:hypothetical protein
VKDNASIIQKLTQCLLDLRSFEGLRLWYDRLDRDRLDASFIQEYGAQGFKLKVCFWNCEILDFGQRVCSASSVQFHRIWMDLLCPTMP